MKLEINPQFPSFHDKRFGDLLHPVLKSKRLKFVSSAVVSVLIASACSGGEMKKQEEVFPRILPLSGEIFLTQGAHANDDSPTGIKSSIDFAPKEVKDCPPGARVIVEQPAVATTSGTITIVGNEKDRNDPNHSIVEIKEDGTGLRFGTMHLDKIPENIQVGEKANKGDVIGKPSCEVPKGGQTTGVHVHSYVKDASGNFLPINGQEVSGWKIDGDKMTRKGEKDRTADTRRCATDTACGGIRNDLVNNPIKTSNKAVLGASAGPIPQISGNVNEKRVEEVVPTPKPTEKPTPTPIAKKETPTPTPTEKPMEQGWQSFTSLNYPYRISYPHGWTAQSVNSILGQKADALSGFLMGGTETKYLSNVTISAQPVEKWVSLADYKQNVLNQLKNYNPNTVDASKEIKKAGNNAWRMFGTSTVELINTKVDNQDIEILSSWIQFPEPEGIGIITTVFLKDGRAWTITFKSGLKGDYANIPFRKMLSSFRFIR